MNDKSLTFVSQLDDLDALLDRALISYTPAERRLGLENRVRARLADIADSPHSRARVPRQLIWAVTSVFAVAALLLMVFRPHARPTPTNLTVAENRAQDSDQAGTSGPAATIVPTLKAAPSSQPSVKPPANPTPKPRLMHRPAQAQSSQQELIARLMANGPEAIASLARDNDKLDKPISIQPLPDDPLVIEPIKITPMDDDPAKPGEKF
jgi:hypothetical protein